jgi:hypothetical protein
MKIAYVFVDREFLQGDHVEKMLYDFQVNCKKKGYNIKLLVLSEFSQGLTQDNLISQYSGDFDRIVLTCPIDEIIYTSENAKHLPLHLESLVKKWKNKSSLDKIVCILPLQNQDYKLFKSVAFDRLIYSTRENSIAAFQECSGFLPSGFSRSYGARLSIDPFMSSSNLSQNATEDTDSDESTEEADVGSSDASSLHAISRRLAFGFGATNVMPPKKTNGSHAPSGSSF